MGIATPSTRPDEIGSLQEQLLGFRLFEGVAAPLVSAAKRMPSGPKASGPMDLKAALPSDMPAVKLAACAPAAARPRARKVVSVFEMSFMAVALG